MLTSQKDPLTDSCRQQACTKEKTKRLKSSSFQLIIKSLSLDEEEEEEDDDDDDDDKQRNN